MTFEEADERLAGGWHVDLPEADVLASAQRKRYLRLERERLLTYIGNPMDLTALGGKHNLIDV